MGIGSLVRSRSKRIVAKMQRCLGNLGGISEPEMNKTDSSQQDLLRVDMQHEV